MATLYTQVQADALQAAIAAGVTNVSYQGKSVTYRSLDEMRLLLTMMNRDISGQPMQRRFLPVTYKHL